MNISRSKGYDTMAGSAIYIFVINVDPILCHRKIRRASLTEKLSESFLYYLIFVSREFFLAVLALMKLPSIYGFFFCQTIDSFATEASKLLILSRSS
jgi:hypothetical protein